MNTETGSEPGSAPADRPFADPDPSGPPEGPPPEPRARRRGLLAVAVAFVVLVGALGFFFLRGSNGTALALSFSPGQTRRYHMTVAMKASIAVGSGTQAQTVPFAFDAAADVQWRVVAVDAAGTATVKVTTSNVSVSSNGQSQTVPSPPAVTIHVSRDGRVASASGLTIVSGSERFPGLDGTDQISALLPDHAVKPGDTWSKSLTRTVLGSTVSFRASGAYLRDERVGTVNAAVIQTKQTVPLRFALTGRDLASLLPGLRGVVPADARVAYSGQVAGVSTTWVDPAGKKVLKTQGTGTFWIDIAIRGVPSTAGLGSLRMSGTESVTLRPI